MNRIICKICRQEETLKDISEVRGAIPKIPLDVCPHCLKKVPFSKSNGFLERAKAYIESQPSCPWCSKKIRGVSFDIFGYYKCKTPLHFCSWECRQAFLNNFKGKFPHMFDLLFSEGSEIQHRVECFCKDNPAGVEIKVKIIKHEDEAEQKEGIRFYDGPRYCGDRNFRGVQGTIDDFAKMVKDVLRKKPDNEEEKN